MISPLHLSRLVKAYQARQNQQNASVTQLDVRGDDNAVVSRAA